MTNHTTTSPIRNGVDTAQIYGTLDAIKAIPSLAPFEFRVRNRWIAAPTAARRSRVSGAPAREDTSRETPFELDASEPPVLFGHARNGKSHSQSSRENPVPPAISNVSKRP